MTLSNVVRTAGAALALPATCAVMPIAALAQDPATQQAWVSQGGAETALANAGGSGHSVDAQGRPVDYFATPAQGFGGDVAVLRTPGSVGLRFGAAMQSVSVAEGGPDTGDTPLSVRQIDPTHWEVSVDHRIADGRFLRIHGSPAPGEERFWVATVHAPAETDGSPSTSVLRVNRLRDGGRSVRLTVSGSQAGALVAYVSLGGTRSSTRARANLTASAQQVIHLRLSAAHWQAARRAGVLVMRFTRPDGSTELRRRALRNISPSKSAA